MKINRFTIQNFFLYLYAFSLNIENFNPTGYFSISKLAAILYLISIVPSFKFYIFLSTRSLYFFWPIIFFFVYLTIISIANINYYSARFIDIAILQNILIFIVIVNHARRDQLILERAMLAFAIGAIFTLMLILLGVGSGFSDEGTKIGRLTFFDAGINELGIKLATGSLIIVISAFQNTLKLNKLRYLMLIFVPFIYITVLQTGSRTAFAVPILAGFIWFFYRTLISRHKFIALITGIGLSAITVVPIVFLVLQSGALNIIIERFTLTGGAGDFSETGRFTLWIGFFYLLRENLIFGNGFSGFDLITFNYFGFLESPHNVILEIMLYTGLIGLSAYLLFLYRVFIATLIMYKYDRNLLPALLIPSILAYVLILQGLSEKVVWLILSYIIGTFLFSSKNYKR